MKRRIAQTSILAIAFAWSCTLSGCFLFSKKPSRAAKRAEARKKRQALAQKALDSIVNTESCENIKKRADQARGAKGSMMKNYPEIGYRAAKCGHWDFVYHRMAMAHPITTDKLYKKLTAKGIDVYGNYGKWLASQKQPYSMKYGGHALINTGRWLTKTHKGKTDHCSAMFAASKRAKGNFDFRGYGRRSISPYARKQVLNKLVQRQLIYYMHTSGCRAQLEDYLISQLESNHWRDRNQACIILGNMRLKKAERKVRSLSSTDSYFFIRRRLNIWPVRNNCRAAYGRINRS
ncbi:MAG: hypothetical protein EP343_02425 [Deltaproteobacteria bacterium]|nr:MAG: hypothetical protein EP343_02425 [Deltaproteobacteria bacterium]